MNVNYQVDEIHFYILIGISGIKVLSFFQTSVKITFYVYKQLSEPGKKND